MSGSTLYLTGNSSSSSLQIGGVAPAVSKSSTVDAFIVALDTTTGSGKTSFGLNASGIQTFGGQASEHGWAITANSSTVYVVGDLGSDSQIGGSGPAVGTGGKSDAFVIALDTVTGLGKAGFGSGGIKSFGGGSGADGAYGVALGGNTVYISGIFNSSDFAIPAGTGPQVGSSGNNDAFIVALDAGTGAPKTSFGLSSSGIQKFGGSNDDYAYGIAVSGSTVCVAGNVASTDAGVGGKGAFDGTGFGSYLLPLDTTFGQITPVITSPLAVGSVPSHAFSYQITASSNPTSFSATGLASAGLTLNSSTGLITGTLPAGLTSYTIGLSATNSFGAGATSNLVLTVIADAVANVYPPIIQGAVSSGGGHALAIDAAGNRYVAGYFSGTVDFNPGAGVDAKSSAGGTDGFVTRFNANGTYAWTQTFGGSGSDNCNGVAVSGSTVYVMGSFSSSNAQIGGTGPFAAAQGSSAAFVIALDAATGAAITGFGLNSSGIQTFCGSAGEVGNDLVVNGSTLYLAGSFSGTAQIGGSGQAVSSSGLNDAFVLALDATTGLAKPAFGLNSSGVQTYGGSTGNDYAFGLAASGTTVYCTGYFGSTTAQIGGAGPSVSKSGADDAFVIALDATTGAAQTAFGLSSSGIQTFGGTDEDIGSGVLVSGGTLYVTGSFASASAKIGGTGPGISSAGSGGNGDAFVLALDPATGVAKSFGINSSGIATFGGSAYDTGYSMAVNGTTLYVAGFFQSEDARVAGTGPTVATAGGTGDQEAFVWALNTGTGAAQTTFGYNSSGVQRFGGSGNEVAFGILISGSTLYVAGVSSSTNAGVGGTGSFNATGFGGFLLPIDSATGALIPPIVTTPANITVPYSASAQNATLTATVSGASIGTVNFQVKTTGGTLLAAAAGTLTAGSASTTVSLAAGTAPGTYVIEANYVVTGTQAAGNTGSAVLTVTSPTTVTAASTSTQFSLADKNITLNAAVTSPTAAVNGGTVTFQLKSGSTAIGSAVASSVVSGAASVAYVLPGNTPAGTYTISASYAGTSVFLSSADTAHTLTVIPPPPVAALAVTGFTSPITAGTASTFTVTALDSNSNTLTTYAGTIAITSDDPAASLPQGTYTFGAGDLGVHTFTGTLRRSGTHSITATDAASIVSGSQTGIVVNALAAIQSNVRAWGLYDYGQLGDGRSNNIPTPVINLSGVTKISAGNSHTLALRNDGTVWAWGENEFGQLGNGSTSDSSTPVRVSGLSGITAIAGGYYHSLALKNDGTVWAWGYNYDGELGNGSNTDSSTPVQVSGLSGVTAIAGGELHSLALKNDGTVWAWGNNEYGQLGNGTLYNSSSTPAQVSGISGITAIAGGGEHSLALKNDGTVWAWGNNFAGELGNGTFNGSNSTAAQVSGLSGVTAIAGGFYHSLALKNDGTVSAWGYNVDGELGNGSNTNSSTPVQVSGLSGVTAIAGGGNHSLAVKNGGTVWAWGYNYYGELGNNVAANSTTPVPVSGLSGVTAVTGGSYHSLALKNDGTLSAWGYNFEGELGIGSTSDSNTPVPVGGLSGVTAIAGGGSQSLALKADGTVWAWGNGNEGELGIGSSIYSSDTPVQVSGLTGVTAIVAGYYHNLVLKNDGTVWAWGYNDSGQLGNGNLYSSSTPAQVSGLSGVTAIAGGGYHSLALKNDGTVWAWGYNYDGELGNGSTTNSSTPVQVSSLSGVTAIAGGAYHSLALKNDGTVWAWGCGGFGELGNGSTSSSSTPVQISGLSGATAIAGGSYHSLALKNDGTVWAWGYNYDGELGNGSNSSSSTPVQVSGLIGITAIAGGGFHSLALKNDGTVWAWGSNYRGELGNGSNTNSNVPVQTETLASIIKVAGGGGHSLAVVNGPSATHFVVSAPTTASAGVAFNATVFAVDANNNSIAYTGTVHFTSSDLAAGVPGDYTFLAGDQGIKTVSVTLNSLGSQSLTATDTVTPSLTGTQSVSASSIPTTTTSFSASVNFNAAAQSVTLSAQVTSTGGTVNEGTVTFQVKDGQNNIGNAVVSAQVSNGSAIVSYTLPGGVPAAKYSIVASFSGGPSFAASSGSTGTLFVGQAAINMTATPANASVPFSLSAQPVTLTAAIASSAGMVNQGTVAFRVLDGNSNLVGIVTNSATLTTGNAGVSYLLPPATVPGTYTIQANYSGGQNFLPGSGSATLTVTKAASATVATGVSINFSTFDQNVDLFATVTSAAGTLNEGTVTFQLKNGGTNLGTAVTSPVLSNGVAHVIYVLPGSTPAATYTIFADYSGTANINPSSDHTQPFTVVFVPAAATITVQNTSVQYNAAAQSVPLSTTVTSQGGIVNEGTVTFQLTSNGVNVGSAVTSATVSNGNATTNYTLPAGAALGTYAIQTNYSGGPDFASSIGSLSTLTVVQASTTTAAQNTSAAYSASAQSVTLSAAVTSSGGTINEGNITFTVKNGATVIGAATTSATVVNGAASVLYALPAGLPIGAYTILAAYANGTNYATSSDTTHSLSIGQTATITTAQSATTSYSASAQSVTLNATVTSSSGTINEGNITFAVKNGATLIGAATTSATVVNGVASVSYTLPAALTTGTYTIVAAYGSGTNFATSSDSAHTLTINKATPTISWSNPADIPYGTALSVTQFNAVPSVPGTLTYTPVSGTVLSAGNGQTLQVSFVPTDTTDYNNASSSVNINVLKKALTATANPGAKIYGTVNPAFTGTLTGVVAGDGITATYNSTATTATIAGVYDSSKPEAITPILSDSNSKLGNYSVTLTKATLTINPATPIITWSTPADITYGTALSATQLNATANVSGTYVYIPAPGTMLSAGNNQMLSVSFTPTDTTDYTTANGSVTINVLKASLIPTADAGTKVYGTANPVFTGTLIGVLAGDGITASYISSATLTTTAETYDPSTPEAITPVLDDPNGKLGNYSVTSNNATLTITKATATITLDNLLQAYDGTPKMVSISTLPVPNLQVDLTYGGNASAPSAAGSYAVVAMINDVNYMGIQLGTLIIDSTTIISGPTATPNPVNVLQTVSFAVAATNSNNDSLTYTWNFGDGSQAIGSSVIHAYAAPSGTGQYTATVTITDGTSSIIGNVIVTVNPLPMSIIGDGPDSDGDGFSDSFEAFAGTNPASFASTPTGQPVTANTVLPLTISKAQIKINFKSNTFHDSITFSGTLSVPQGFDPTAAVVVIDAGGVLKRLLLGSNGSVKVGNDSFKLTLKLKKGVVQANSAAPFAASFTKGTFASQLDMWSNLKITTSRMFPAL